MSIRIRLAAVTLVLAGLVAYAACRWWFPFRAVVRPWRMNAEWIAAPGASSSSSSFRRVVTLPGEVRNAWIAIAGADSFELSVNGRTVSSLPLTRATLPFQRSLSDRGQQVRAGPPMLPRQRPREYQWSGFRSWRLPIFVDLTRDLAPGRNVLCIAVASRTGSPRLCVEGEIEMRSGAVIPVRSGSEWKAAAIPPRAGDLDWTQTNYPGEDWARAAPVAPPRGEMLRTIEPGIFREPFAGHWLRAPMAAAERPLLFETSWRIDGRPGEAWLRLVANRGYDLAINGRSVRPPPGGAGKLRDGVWLLDSPDPRRGETDEVESILEEESGATRLVEDDRGVAAFDLYDVRWLLQRGENRIVVRLHPTKESLHWEPQFALDAKAIRADGWVDRIASGPGWRCDGVGSEAIVTGAADSDLPRKIYAGLAWNAADKFRSWLVTALGVLCVVIGAVVIAVRRSAVLLVPIVLLSSAVLIESAWVEREESLLFLTANAWGWILACAALSALLGAFIPKTELGSTKNTILTKTEESESEAPLARRVSLSAVTNPFRVFRGPSIAALRAQWPRFALCWILLLCAWLRARALDSQPLDPDEYASAQAILSIARTGAPQLFDTVFYTRSPLYHYLVGGIVALFGENIWALRLPSVFFGVATAALLYLFGARLLRSRWTGLAAAALFAIHPFAAFSGYLVRFYQQQQFFALLTVYFFCRGFVVGQGMRERYLMLAAFFATVLSQELSLTIGFSLLLGYVLFAERKAWQSEARFAVAAGCVLVLVFLDLVIFQTRCLTRVDGISPSLEPTLTLNLESPSNLLMLFMVFSRLHLALSILLLVSLPLLLRQRDRAALALLAILFSGIVVTTIFVTGSGLRYHYWLIPLWLVLGIHGVRTLTARQPALGALLIAAVVLTWSPWRLFDSFDTKIQTDSTAALAYVRRNARAGDAIMVSAPHTQSALLEIGRIDYDLAIPLLHDFFYRKDGRLIDRNAGAEAIRNLDMLQEKCAAHERLWVLINREDLLRSPGQDIRWSFPGARTDLFLRTNLELMFRSYLWDVFLWDAATGRFHTFRRAR